MLLDDDDDKKNEGKEEKKWSTIVYHVFIFRRSFSLFLLTLYVFASFWLNWIEFSLIFFTSILVSFQMWMNNNNISFGLVSDVRALWFLWKHNIIVKILCCTILEILFFVCWVYSTNISFLFIILLRSNWQVLCLWFFKKKKI